MVVCNFFMQGRCRYGDKCWNEHPSGGNSNQGAGGGGSRGGYNNSRPPSNRGGGGFSNRVWVNPSQRSGGNYVQPSSFSRGGDDWDRGGGGGGGGGNQWGEGARHSVQSSDFSFSSQNRFSSLNNSSSFDKGGREGSGDENEKHLETIQKDMEIWETSGQWVFSCYSVLKATISGFTDLSPEELRMEYYNNRASGDLQGYANGINLLISQWKSRVQELRAMNSTARVAMLAELQNPAPQITTDAFGSTGTGFGSSDSSFGTGGFGAPPLAPPLAPPSGASSFSFAAPSAGFGLPSAPSAPAGFGTAAQPPSGFGSSSSAPSASSFSFAAPAAGDSKAPPTSAFGGSAAGFSFSSAPGGAGGFGSAPGVAAPTAGGSLFGQTSGNSLFGGSGAAPVAGGGGSGGDCLFTPQGELTPEELSQFGAKRFTLGQIPLRPPPADMLVV